MKLSPAFVAPIIYSAYKLWCSSLRIVEYGREKVDQFQHEKKTMVFSLWHDEVFPLMYVRRTLPIMAIVSRSQDGEYMSGLLEALGHRTARGSSSKGGTAALLRTAKTMRDENYFACITVDGPRGPRHEVKEGALFLAAKASAYLVPMRTFYSKSFKFKSWDKFQLPLPFSKAVICFGEPYQLSAEPLTGDYFNAAAGQLKCILDEMINPEPDDVKNSWGYKLGVCLSSVLQKAPLSILHKLAQMSATIFWRFAVSRRTSTINAIQKHLHFPKEKAERVARQSFSHNFMSFSEIFYAKQLCSSPQDYHCGESPGLSDILHDSGPIVIATAHLGAWELMGAYAARLLPHKERIVVVRTQKNLAINALMLDLRTSGGVTAVGHRQASKIALHCLRKNGLVGFLVDHNSNRKESVFLPFLEDIAAVNLGPALLALRAKASVYPTFLLRDEQNHLFLHVDKPLRTGSLHGSLNERSLFIAQYYTEAVARCVRRYPNQWFWMHQRWKTRVHPDQ